MSENEPIKLTLSGEMREHLIAVHNAAQEDQTRIPVFAVKLTVLIEATSSQDAYESVHETSEHLFDVWGVRSIYYADVIHKVEVDENGDILTDSVPDGFTFG